MHELVSAAVGGIVSTVLGIWLLPIWRAAKLPPETRSPREYQSKSLNTLIFLAFRWLFWSEIWPTKELVEIMTRRLHRLTRRETQMVAYTSGTFVLYSPIPMYTSIFYKMAYLIPVSVVILIAWALGVTMIIAPLMHFSFEQLQASLNSGFEFIGISILIEFAIFFVLAATGNYPHESRIAVLIKDGAIFIAPNFDSSLKALPQWRVIPEDDVNNFHWRSFSEPMALVEMSVDSGMSWQPVCPVGRLAYKISRFVERDRDWRSAFVKFSAIVASEATRVPS